MILSIVYLVLPFIALCFNVTIAFNVSQRLSVRGAREFVSLLIVQSVTIILVVVALISDAHSISVFWFNALQTAQVIHMMLLVKFVATYTDKLYLRKRKWLVFLFVATPTISSIFLWSNRWQELYNSDWGSLRINGFYFMHTEAGWADQLYVVWLATTSLWMIVTLLVYLTQVSDRQRVKILGIILGLLGSIFLDILLVSRFPIENAMHGLNYLVNLPVVILFYMSLFGWEGINATNVITYDDVLNNLQEGIIVADEKGNIIQFNQTAIQWLGVTYSSLMGETAVPFLRKRLIRTDRSERLLEAIEYGKLFEAQVTLKAEESTVGDERTFLVRTRPIKDDQRRLGQVVIGQDITERLKLEQVQVDTAESLVVVRDSYQRLVDSVPGMVFQLSMNREQDALRYDYVSQASQLICGYSPQYIYNNQEQFTSRFHPKEEPAIWQALHRSAKELTSLNFLAQVQMRSGEYEWHEFYASPVQQADGRVSWQGIELNVMERYTSQERIQENEEMVRSIIQSMDDRIFALDASGHFVAYYQGKNTEHLTLPPEAFMGKHYTNAGFPSHVVQKFVKAIKQAYSSRETQTVEYLLNLRDAEEIFRGTVTNRYNTAGDVAGYTIITTNITQERKNLEQLASNEQLFREIWESLPIPIYVLTRQGEAVLINSPFTELFGYTLEDVPTVEKWLETVYPTQEERTLALERWQNRVEHLVPSHTMAVTMRDKQGKEKKMLQFSAFAGDLYVITLLDVTHQYRIEEALKIAKEAAEKANLAKSRFLASMSHELRTPLNAILGFADLLNQSDLPGEGNQQVQTIRRSGKHLLALINDVLELSKIEAGKQVTQLEPFALHDLLRETFGMFTLQAEEKGLVYTAEIAPELPHQIKGDKLKLRQILLNLLSNAIKFTKYGSVTLLVTWHYEAKQMQITVKDTGLGIAPDEQVELFTPFVQTESGRKSQEGTGLGLALVQEYVFIMNGSISFNTVYKKGTTFQVTLPVTPLGNTIPNGDSAKSSHGNRRVVSMPTGGRIPRILVVDDIETNLNFLDVALKRAGFTVATAEDGQQAIEQARTFQPDLIFMDLHMPIMTGYDAAYAIKEFAPHILIVALTASTFEEQQKLDDAGFCDYIHKPITHKDLLDVIARKLDVSYSHQKVQRTVVSGFPDQIDHLPRPLLNTLYTAVLSLNQEETNQAVNELTTHDPQLATYLARLVKSYQQDKIATWLTPFMSKESHENHSHS